MIQFNDRVRANKETSLEGHEGTVKEVLPSGHVSVLLDSGGREWFLEFELEVIE